MHRGLAAAQDFIADQAGSGIDQAAFHARFGDHKLALLAKHLALRILGVQSHGFDGLPRKLAAQMRAPRRLQIKAAVRWQQGLNLHARGLQPRHPSAVRPELFPARAAQRQDSRIGFHQALPLKMRKLQAAIFIPSQPAMPRMKSHALAAKPRQPSAQQRRSLHVFRKHALRTAHKGFNPQPVNPIAQSLRAQRLRAQSLRAQSLQPRPHLRRAIAVARDKALKFFCMRDVQPADAGQQQLAAHRWHRVIHIHLKATLSQHLRRHQARRACSNDHY